MRTWLHIVSIYEREYDVILHGLTVKKNYSTLMVIELIPRNCATKRTDSPFTKLIPSLLIMARLWSLGLIHCVDAQQKNHNLLS